MIVAEKQERINLDPRTKIILLFVVNIIVFTSYKLYIEVPLISVLAILLIICGCSKSAIKLTVFFSILVAIQYLVIPILPNILVMTFTILSVMVRKLLPCIMIGNLLFQTTPVRMIMATLRKWHITQKITIPLAITIRYFPTLKEEYMHIKDAMKLRSIKGIRKKIECIYVPLLVSAVHTSEELTSAAITRGIDNPSPKTCITNTKFQLSDYVCFGVTISFIVVALIMG